MARQPKDTQQASLASSPRSATPAGANSQPTTVAPTPRAHTSAASNLAASHPTTGLQSSVAGGDLNHPISLFDPLLDLLAAALDDAETVRISQANRYRILTSTEVDADGITRGFGLDDDAPAVAVLRAQLDALDAMDKALTKALSKQLRTHPLYPWIKAQNGLGDKTIARLLATIGDPYWNDLHDRPRTVGELFAFCGVAGPGQRRARGQKSTWNPNARKRLWIITGPIIRNLRSPYRAVYDAGRERYADKVHTSACAQCGVKGQPAEIGTPWRDGHKHAGAIRLVMREILRDLWTEARHIHEPGSGIEAQAA